MFAATSVLQTDSNATRAYRDTIAYRLLDAQTKRKRVDDLKQWVAAGRPLKRTRVPAGVGHGPLAGFLRSDAPSTRTCAAGALRRPHRRPAHPVHTCGVPCVHSWD